MARRHTVIGALVAGLCTHGAHTLADRTETPIDLVLPTIAQEEGFRGTCYEDSQGHPTIGHGTLLPITADEGLLLERSRLEGEERRLREAWAGYATVPIEAQAATLDLGYVVGVAGELGFRRMLEALDRQDYGAAADEVLDSRFDHQDRARAERIAGALRSLE